LSRSSTELLEVLRTGLSELGIDALAAPERLPWLGVCVVAGIGFALRRRYEALTWPGMSEARQSGARPLDGVAYSALMLRASALVCLALVLAEPTTVHESPPEPGLGLDLVLAVDTSASMRALDTSAATLERDDGGAALHEPERTMTAQTRLDLAKRVVSRFARSRVAEGDRVGLVVFGSSAFTSCPLTSDGRLLEAALQRVEVGVAGEATALGDALALAVKRIPKRESVAGRVIVLLTDGRSNAGSVPVHVAALIARGEQIRVHTVGIGTGGQEVPVATRSHRPERALRFERHDTDPEALRQIARATGGRHFEATRPSDLESVYREVDNLERVERPLPPRIRRAPRAEPLLAAAGGFVLLEVALAGVLRRRIP
jgi:Ca-activated chloride channel family protein